VNHRRVAAATFRSNKDFCRYSAVPLAAHCKIRKSSICDPAESHYAKARVAYLDNGAHQAPMEPLQSILDRDRFRSKPGRAVRGAEDGHLTGFAAIPANLKNQGGCTPYLKGDWSR